MLLSITAISLSVWLYEIANDHLYGGWIHLFLALGLSAFLLHLCLPRYRRSPQSTVEDPTDQRRACSLLTQRPGEEHEEARRGENIFLH
jgi:hypothetical protein